MERYQVHKCGKCLWCWQINEIPSKICHYFHNEIIGDKNSISPLYCELYYEEGTDNNDQYLWYFEFGI